MNETNCKILVCCHKKDIFAKEPPYFPIQVGKAISSVDLGITGDDTGDNISEKNPSYCELTGLYWAWKNLKNTDIIGLCHYRRYFDFHGQTRRGFPWTAYKTDRFGDLDLSIPQKILDAVQKGAVVMAKPRTYRNTLFVEYCTSHISDDIRLLHNVIKVSQPQNIQDAFFKIVYQGNKLRHFNMFIMRWDLFDLYCSWLFPLLGTMEGGIDISHYSTAQKRIFGYMAERLLNVWVEANGIPVIEKPVLWFNDAEDPLSMYSPLRYRLRLITNRLAHFFSKPRQ